MVFIPRTQWVYNIPRRTCPTEYTASDHGRLARPLILMHRRTALTVLFALNYRNGSTFHRQLQRDTKKKKKKNPSFFFLHCCSSCVHT